MSLKVIYAVHASKLEPRLRPLAQTLAIYADDDGCNIWPGVTTLMKALGVKERAIREKLQELVGRQVLIRDGFRHHTRCYRYDLKRLASYQPDGTPPPREPCTGAHGSGGEPCAGVHRSDPEPCTDMHGPSDETLHHGALNPAALSREPCTVPPETMHHGAVDLQDLHDLQEERPTPSTGFNPVIQSSGAKNAPATPNVTTAGSGWGTRYRDHAAFEVDMATTSLRGPFDSSRLARKLGYAIFDKSRPACRDDRAPPLHVHDAQSAELQEKLTAMGIATSEQQCRDAMADVYRARSMRDRTWDCAADRDLRRGRR